MSEERIASNERFAKGSKVADAAEKQLVKQRGRLRMRYHGGVVLAFAFWKTLDTAEVRSVSSAESKHLPAGGLHFNRCCDAISTARVETSTPDAVNPP